MSSSAFTPSTTTVTNNVPVNVPVVTAWEDVSSPAIPTGLGSGSGTWAYYKTRRVGGNLEILARFNKDATAGTGSTNVSFSLPYSNITIDSSVNTIGYATSFFVGGVAGFRTLTAARGTSTTFVFDKDLGSDAVKGSDIVGGAQLRFFVSLPIAEWSTSGTTTLATRAVEEYASNSSTSDASDTTSFVYGPNGATTPGPLTAYRTKRVRFQTPILSTDSIYLEGRASLTSPWAVVQALDGGNGLSPLQLQAGVYYGIGLNASLINSTDIDVSFGRYAFSNGATYGAAGAQWSTSLGYWRVRKVSGGAAVGYPVSARNIVGNASGSVVPVGMIGQLVTAIGTRAFSVVTGNTWYVGTLSSGSGITLTPGVWLVGYSLETGWTGGTNAVTTAILTTDTSDGSPSNNTSASLTSTAAFLGNIEGFTQTSTVPVLKEASGYLNVTSNTTYTIKVNANVTTFTGSYTCRFYAIRIA